MGFFSFFRRKRSRSEIDAMTPIEAGQVWAIRNESPWPKEGSEVRILDAKDGWVRYAFPSVFTDERMRERTFRSIYERVS